MLNKSAETINWHSTSKQQVLFEQYKSKESRGLKFDQFQEFLSAFVYKYFALFPKNSKVNDNKKQSTQDTDNFESCASLKTKPDEDDECRFTNQQELQLFKIFDSNNDHVVDRDEFGKMCSNWLSRIYNPACALIIVDVQNDFIDGSLALINGPAGQDGAEVVPVINDLLANCSFKSVFYTQDWHPINHIGFHSNLHLRKYSLQRKQDESHVSLQDGTSSYSVPIDDAKLDNDQKSGKKKNGQLKLKKLVPRAQVFDTVFFEDGTVEQKLWPVHCVQESWGAQLHPGLRVLPDGVKIQKGTLPDLDAYSAFWDNLRRNETNLRRELVDRKIDCIFFCGLAMEVCVTASAIDAVRAGFMVFVIEDACRGFDNGEMLKSREKLIANDVIICTSKVVTNFLMPIENDKEFPTETSMTQRENMCRDVIRKISFTMAMSR